MENEIFNLDYKDQDLKIERFDVGEKVEIYSDNRSIIQLCKRP